MSFSKEKLKLIMNADFHVIYEADIPEPRSNAKDNRTLYLFHCLQTFLVHNLMTGNIVKLETL